LIPARFISDIHFFCHRQKSTFHFFCLSSIANGENACMCIRDLSVCNNRGLHHLLIASCPIMPNDYHIYFNTIQSFFPVGQNPYLPTSLTPPFFPPPPVPQKDRIRLVPFFFFFFGSTKPPNDSFGHFYPRRPGIASSALPNRVSTVSDLWDLPPPRFARRAFAVPIASSVANVAGRRDPRYSTLLPGARRWEIANRDSNQ